MQDKWLFMCRIVNLPKKTRLTTVCPVCHETWYLQEEEAAIEALLAEDVDTSDLIAAAAELPDLTEQLESAAEDEATRGAPLSQEAVQEYINALRAVDVSAGENLKAVPAASSLGVADPYTKQM